MKLLDYLLLAAERWAYRTLRKQDIKRYGRAHPSIPRH